MEYLVDVMRCQLYGKKSLHNVIQKFRQVSSRVFDLCHAVWALTLFKVNIFYPSCQPVSPSKINFPSTQYHY